MARTLLLGLDGMTFTILDPLVEEGRLPFFSRVIEEGVRAELRSTANPLTPPAWTTLMTGRGPGAHGVFDFMRFEEGPEGPYGALIFSHDVRCETIWSIASRQGGKIISLNFPAMFPVRPIDGFVVPGYVTARQLKTSVFPRALYPRLKALPGFNPKEFAWNMDESRKGVEGLPPEDYESWIRYVMDKDGQWVQIATMLMKEENWSLAAILFDGVDRLQHLVWRFLDPALADSLGSEWERRIRELAIEYFVRLDKHLADLVAVAGPDTRVFLASDHGAGSTTEIFYANAWLASRGYLTWKDGTELDVEDRLSAPHIFDFFQSIDWRRTKAYVRSASSNGIYIRKARPEGGGVKPEEYEAFRAKLVEELLEFRDPANGERIVSRVMLREEAFPGEAMEDAPDITLFLRDGGFPSIMPSQELLKPRKEVVGMHRPEGVFMAVGPGIRKGESLPPKDIVDTTPTMLHSLGLPVPSDFEGKVIEDAYEGSFLASNPIRIGEKTLDPREKAGAANERTEMKTEDEAQLLDQLRRLGYID